MSCDRPWSTAVYWGLTVKYFKALEKKTSSDSDERNGTFLEIVYGHWAFIGS